MSKKLTTIEFIKRSNIIHNNFYNYNKTNYINNMTKVIIICPVHGEFQQIPSSHLKGKKCIYCVGNKKSTTEDFIKNANIVHNNKYDYSLVKYINNSTLVDIICPIHGIFHQIPTAHINKKQQCPYCKKNKKLTTIKFITRANNIHNNKYDYSLVEYINAKTNIKIICPVHGEFLQNPDNHIRKKYGCPICNSSKGEIKIKKILESKNIKYEIQKTFKNCKYKQSLKFDFYLIDYNTCIEYDGEQHFIKYRFEKNEEKLKIRQLRDSIKNEFCLNNNISLIRINFDDDIEYKLNKLYFLI